MAKNTGQWGLFVNSRNMKDKNLKLSKDKVIFSRLYVGAHGRRVQMSSYLAVAGSWWVADPASTNTLRRPGEIGGAA